MITMALSSSLRDQSILVGTPVANSSNNSDAWTSVYCNSILHYDIDNFVEILSSGFRRKTQISLVDYDFIDSTNLNRYIGQTKFFKSVLSKMFLFNIYPSRNHLLREFEKYHDYFMSYEGENGQKISEQTFENAIEITRNLSKIFNDNSTEGIEFEPDSDGSILIFIDRGEYEIIINVFEDRIEYSQRKLNVEDSFKAYQIPITSLDDLNQHLMKWFGKEDLWLTSSALKRKSMLKVNYLEGLASKT